MTLFSPKRFSNLPTFYLPLPQPSITYVLEDYKKILTGFPASTFALTISKPFSVLFLKTGNTYMI